MYSNRATMTFTTNCSAQIDLLRQAIENADAILIGAGAGLSVSAGFAYDGVRFWRHFSDFAQKYGITDMYTGGFYPFDTLEEYWAWWSRMIAVNRYEALAGQPYRDLLALVRHKNYFVLTTNVDHQFQLAGFEKERLFYTQGDFGLWQCSQSCHDRTYDNEQTVMEMVRQQKGMKIPSELIPYCPVCGAPMTMNLRCDDNFVQDVGWYRAAEQYERFVQRYAVQRILFLELGVGSNTPGIIKYPFWRMTAQNPDAVYACINQGEAICPEQIRLQSICLDVDIAKVLVQLKMQKNASCE